MAASNARQYAVTASSTPTFGRMIASARDQHFVADGPAQNGCPGEAVTPAELFLAGVATCGVELVQVLARESNVPLSAVDVTISGVIDRGKPVRPDVTLFNSVRIEFNLAGVTQEQGGQLIEKFKGR
jgi:uncharacterized OsmC-like protein